MPEWSTESRIFLSSYSVEFRLVKIIHKFLFFGDFAIYLWEIIGVCADLRKIPVDVFSNAVFSLDL